MLHDFSSNNFSVVLIIIRSVNNNFQNFKLFLSFLNFTFSIICFSETCLDVLIFTSTLLYELPNYVSKHHLRSDSIGGGVSIYIYKFLNFKIRNDLNVNIQDRESLSVEILPNKKRNTLNFLCRRPNGQNELFETFFKLVFSKTKN